jgi:RND family efflux transporter MFP subunit
MRVLTFAAAGGLLLLAAAAPPGADLRPVAEDSTTCLIKPRQLVQIGSPVAGLLSEELVDRGDTIGRGEVIARIESSIERADLALDRLKAANDTAIRAEMADLQMAQRMLERKRFLVQRQDVNENALDEVQTKAEVGALRVQQAQMDQRVAALTAERTERLLDLKQIRSPLDGVVIERKMSVGEYVYEQTPVMTIAQIDPLSVELIVPAARYGQIHVGGGARVHPDAPVGGDYPATVEVVDPMIDASSGTFGVRLKLANPDHLIPAGLRCAVQLLPQGGTAATRGAQPRTP